jgi:predicted lipid-binding transport protein (Tim44 family)
MYRICIRTPAMTLAALAIFAVLASDADARPRFSAGSRGSRTYLAPPPTATAPGAAQPIERSAVQPGAASAARPSPATATSGFFNRPGILGGLAAGFLGAGLFGLLSGHGLLGGLGGFASVFGLLLQLVLVFFIGRLIWSFWQRRNAPAFAGTPGLGMSDFGNRGMGSGYGGQGGAEQDSGTPLQLKPEDFDTFERLLGEVLMAYGVEDVRTLRELVTPEMLSYYSESLAQLVSSGDTNKIADVKLLQGDLSEAWSEGDSDYATVTMRFSLNDRIVDRKDGHLVEQLPSEVTEWWTFQRVQGGKWLVAGVQQQDDRA